MTIKSVEVGDVFSKSEEQENQEFSKIFVTDFCMVWEVDSWVEGVIFVTEKVENVSFSCSVNSLLTMFEKDGYTKTGNVFDVPKKSSIIL